MLNIFHFVVSCFMLLQDIEKGCTLSSLCFCTLLKIHETLKTAWCRGVTKQCGALSRSRVLGPLFFCKSSLLAKPEITPNCINFLHAIFKQY